MKDNEIREIDSFVEGIKLSSKRLGFSVTKACPLRCSHCSVSADPHLGKTTYPPEFTSKIVNEMVDIHASGIKYIDFTGGEPTLAVDFVSKVSTEAKKYDIKTGIVTAAHWATTKERARKTIEKFINVDEWDISTDIYHLDFVSLDNVILAYTILKEEYDKNPIIRVAYHEPFTKDDAELIIKLDKLFGRNLGFQPIGPVGRAQEFIQNPSKTIHNYDKSPCPSTGLLIQPYGVAVSCCAPLSHEDYDHPLRLGNAFSEPIRDIVFKWRTNPLLQTIRLWGFEPVVDWLSEEGVKFDSILKNRACQTCVSLIQNVTLCKIAYSRANEFRNKLSLAISLKEFFDEPYMEEIIKNEASLLLQNP